MMKEPNDLNLFCLLNTVLLVDLWNVIEGFRENGLNGLDPYSIITVPKLESVVSSLYCNLNKVTYSSDSK